MSACVYVCKKDLSVQPRVIVSSSAPLRRPVSPERKEDPTKRTKGQPTKEAVTFGDTDLRFEGYLEDRRGKEAQSIKGRA